MRDVTQLPWLVVSPTLGVVGTFYLNVDAVTYKNTRKFCQVLHRDQYQTQRESSNAN